jgi:hypothetical protein
MTEHHEPDPVAETPEPAAGMPRWVPVLIGALLVGMAALAVFTGLRYRSSDTITSEVRPRSDRRANTPAPPGEPGAGASLVYHGSEGDATPAANEAVTGDARAVIEGGPGGVSSTVRMWARRGMVLNVFPEDAVVFVNDLPIGEVAQFNTMDEVYDFAAPGSYTVRVVAPGGAEKTFIVTATDDAKQDVARISVKLQP